MEPGIARADSRISKAAIFGSPAIRDTPARFLKPKYKQEAAH
jgi:hypothetical protein